MTLLKMLAKAVEEGDEELLLTVLGQGGDPTATVSVREHGVQTSWCLLTLATELGHAQLVPHLLANDLDVEGSGQTSLTPLHRAARKGHHEVLVALLAAGANPHSTDDAG